MNKSEREDSPAPQGVASSDEGNEKFEIQILNLNCWEES